MIFSSTAAAAVLERPRTQPRTAPRTQPRTSHGSGFGAPSPERRWLVPQGPQSDNGWLRRCVALAQKASDHGYAVRASFLSRSMRHEDCYCTESGMGAQRVAFRVVYAPNGPHHASLVGDGAWRCQCSAFAVGAPCAHVGAAYLAACERDAQRAAHEQHIRAHLAQLQRQATAMEGDIATFQTTYCRIGVTDGWHDSRLPALDELIKFLENRYRATVAQMTSGRAELLRHFATTYQLATV